MIHSQSQPPIIPEGHPPIHPLNLDLTPEKVEQGLKELRVEDAEKLAQLYRLIYEGTLATQTEPPILKYIRWRFRCVSQKRLRLEAETIKIEQEGWLKFDPVKSQSLLNQPNLDEQLAELQPNHSTIKIIDTKVEPVESNITHHTIISLMNALESLQIGRPSTYGSIFRNLQEKGHISITEDGVITLTERGKKVQEAIATHLPILADISFTMELEAAFKAIIQGQRTSLSVLKEYWSLLDPQNRYPKPQTESSSRSSLGDKIKAQTPSTPQWIIPTDTHPLHQANKILEKALEQCSFSFNERIYVEDQMLPDLNKVVRVWFLGHLYGLKTQPFALLDRLIFDSSFRWFAQIPINRKIWTIELYLKSLKYLQDKEIISKLFEYINWDSLQSLQNSHLFLGLNRRNQD